MPDLPSVGDLRSRELAERLRRAATMVVEPQLSKVKNVSSITVFVSHTSADDDFIKGTDGRSAVPKPGSIWWITGEHFFDPFYHSFRTGGAEAYERIVGLALLSSRHVLIVWSENALRSDYVRAEILIATAGDKKVAVYLVPNAPLFPIPGVELVKNCEGLAELMKRWKYAANF